MGGSLRQLYIILWKDVYVNQIRRNFVWTLLELALAVIAMYGIGRDGLEEHFGDPVPAQVFPRVQPLQLWEHRASKILYAPDVPLLREVMRGVREDLTIHSAEPVSSAAVLNELLESGVEAPFAVGVAFDHDNLSAQGLPNVLRYRIRFQSGKFDIHLRYRHKLELPGPKNVYSSDEMSALLPLQYSVERHLLHRLSVAKFGPSEEPAQLQLQRFPYPAFYPEGFNTTFSHFVFHFGVGFLLPFASVVVKITGEKCSGMRELLSIAGTSELVYWGSNFLSSSFRTALLSCVCMLFLFVFGANPALGYSDPLLVFVVLLNFCSLTTLHAMFVSVLLTSSRLSIVFSMIYWICSIAFPYLMLQNPLGRGYYLRSRTSKIVTSLSPGMGLHWAFMVIERFERFLGGVNWGNMYDSSVTLDNVSLSDLMMVNVCTCFLMVFLIWYADNIIPWGPGIHKPPWFPFLKSYWIPEPAKTAKTRSDADPSLFEAEPEDLNPAIEVTSLKKLYRNFLLQHINLKIFRHQITVLMGPSGSGKSTMIKMVTGLVHPTSGKIIVDNYDVVMHTDEARERISYCPADNVLFEELTVEEHLLFFAMLKGLGTSKIRPEIKMLLTDMEMSNYLSCMPSTLSDGTKRLLCVAITLLVGAKCKIMILDEPTASMDPHSRREVWELLLKARRHCCIVLTTANLYEADVLADKIAIMNRGLLWCCGSPGFLRQRFSTGYHVRIVKQPGCDVAAIEALFRRHVPRTTVKQNTNLAVEYAIGANPGNRRLTAMFKELERERHNLKIGPMSVAMASLEDVLDKVSQDPTFQSRTGREHAPATADPDAVYKPKLHVQQSSNRQLAGLLRKRFCMWSRDWQPPVVRWVVPVSVLLLSAGLRQAFTTAGLDSNRFYQDRLLYDSKRLNVHSPLGFITAKRNGDPVMQHLKALFAEENIRLTPISAEHTSARLLDFADDDPKTYNYQLLFGAIFNGDSAPTLWFNGQCPHAASLLVNLYHTALLRNLTGQPSARIMLYNHPYSNDSAANRSRTGEPKPDMLQQLLQGSLAFDGRILSSDGLLVQALSGIFTPLALCFHAASFVVFPIAERCSKFKHMQMMTGLSGAVYWLSNFIFDVTLAAACAAVFVPAMLLGDKSLDGAAYIGMLALLFIAHGLATVPFSYVASTLFNDSSFGLSFMVIFIFFIGLVGALKTVILHFTETVSEARLLWVLPKAVDILFHSVPTFALTRGIAKLLHLRRENDMCEAGGEFLEHTCHNVDVSHTVSLQYCCNALPTTNANSTDGGSEGRRSSMVQPFELSGTVMVEIYVMLVESVLLLAYLGVMDAPAYVRMRKRLLAPLRKKKSGTPECQASPRLSTSPLDSDVSREAELVEKLCEAPIPDEYALVVRKLYKSYAQCRGVHNVSFALKRNQCLGIIGVAGAGKTELMHLLTGFSEPSSGSAHLGSLTLSGNAKQYISRLGYCPETLGLPEYLTGREVLELFCVLRGFTPSDTASIVKNVLSLMDLSGVANDVTRNYTPGDKRKACIALAIAGLPSVILLDEPGTGVDVSSRAQIRRSLATVREMTDCAILLTSNSMQKCEILCDRIAILLSGQLECIGSLDELRSKFGRGYTITIKLRQETFDDSEFQEDLTNDMKNEFRSCQLDYSFQGVLEYRIATTYTTWGEMFSKMAIIQKKYRFKEFYVCDTTLEQIFVSYARKQTSCTKSLAAP